MISLHIRETVMSLAFETHEFTVIQLMQDIQKPAPFLGVVIICVFTGGPVFLRNPFGVQNRIPGV